MADAAPMHPCPYSRRGGHSLGIVTPADNDGDMTVYCERCGALRRFPASGPLPADRIDDMTADEIAALVGRK